MLAPTPLFRSSPMDLSDLFSAAFAVLKRRFGLFALLLLLPTLIVMIGVAALLIVMFVGVIPSQGSSAWVVAMLVFTGVAIVVGIGSMLLQYKSFAMMTAATYEIGQGQNPTVRSLLATTRGFLPRLTGLILIALGIGVIFYGLIALLFGGIIVGATASGRSTNSTAALASVGLVVLLMLALVPLFVWLGTKLLYVIPAMTIEQTGSIDSLKRSWNLTRGAFWRTLGFYLVAAIAVYAVTTVVSMFSQIWTTPYLTALQRANADIPAVLISMIPFLLISVALQLVVQVFTTPFLYAYQTCMYLDQVRRSEMAQWDANAGYPAAGYPQQGYAQPGYPQQGYPASAWGAPPAPPAPSAPGTWPPMSGQPPQPAPGQGWAPPQPPAPPAPAAPPAPPAPEQGGPPPWQPPVQPPGPNPPPA